MRRANPGWPLHFIRSGFWLLCVVSPGWLTHDVSTPGHAVWNVDAAASVTARLAWPEVSAVAVGAVHFLARDMLGGVHTCRAAAIAFGLFLGHHMAAHRTEPQVFSFHLSSVEVVSRSCFWDGLPDSRLLLPQPTLHGFWFSRPAAQLRRGIVSRRSCGCGVGHETFRSEAPEIEHDALHRDLCHMAAVLSGDVLVGFAADGAHRRSVSFDFSPVVFRCHTYKLNPSRFGCKIFLHLF